MSLGTVRGEEAVSCAQMSQKRVATKLNLVPGANVSRGGRGEGAI